MNPKTVYADNAATTKPSPAALREAEIYMTEQYGNPSSLYRMGKKAKEALDIARNRIARNIGAEPDEIFFTSGGTESDNWAIRGAVSANCLKGRHIITSMTEHPAVFNTAGELEREGCSVTRLGVDRFGRIDIESFRKAVREDTILVSIMTANNETGTIQPAEKIAEECRKRGIIFHTDAVQTAGHMPLDVNILKADLLSASAHKFNGIKGAGFLYIRRGVNINSIFEGGGQESGRRSGTENVAAAAAMAEAFDESCKIISREAARLAELRGRLDLKMLSVPGVEITGCPEERIPGTASYIIKGIQGEAVVLLLDLAGIQISSGSACSEGSLKASRVLTAAGYTEDEAKGSLRISLGRYTTEDDVVYLCEKIPEVIAALRNGSAPG